MDRSFGSAAVFPKLGKDGNRERAGRNPELFTIFTQVLAGERHVHGLKIRFIDSAAFKPALGKQGRV
jgi:hypothetical protein